MRQRKSFSVKLTIHNKGGFFMQRLELEAAWDKTIAPADRKVIIDLFNQTKNKQTESIVLLPIRQALNHRNDLLATVLLHNFTDSVFSFEAIDLAYLENDRMIAKDHFSFPDLTLPKETSMPWTFIFPESTRVEGPSLKNSKLCFL